VAEALSPLDASFLYLERPNVHMHVAGLGILDPSTRPGGRLTEGDLRRLISERIHMVPRFRQKILVPPLGAGRPVWVLPNPSGLNAHHQLADLAARFRAAREHAESLPSE
jgi:diacylglycerol O-acyltransferase